MSTIISAMKKLGFAILLGAAFGLGLIGIIIAWANIGSMHFSFPSFTTKSYTTTQPVTTPEQFLITNTNAILTPPADKNSHYIFGPTWGNVTFTGTIENTGADSNHYLNVYADIFDKDEKFIFQCMTQFSEGLKHNEKQNFLIECHNWPEEVAGKYASFKIYTKGN